MVGFFLAILFLLLCLGCAIFSIAKGGPKNKPAEHDVSRYSKTRNFMDFDPGVDSNKVGNPQFPNAGIDSVMKHEYMNDLLDEDKN